MVAATVSFPGTRVSQAESLTDGGNWHQWDSGKSPAVEPDFVYQFGASNAAISNKVGTSEQGVELEGTTTYDLSAAGVGSADRVVLFKTIATNYAALNAQGATGMVHYIGSGTTTDRYNYYTHGNDEYPIAGGWVFDLIDPNIAGYRSATDGTPDLNAVDYWAVSATFSATSKAENVAMDAIDFFDVGYGLTMYGGDGASTDCAFSDFVTFDEGTAANRYGIVRTVEGVILTLGTLRIGDGTNETDFTDATGGTMVFPDGRFGPGTAGLRYDLSVANSVMSTSDWSFVGRGSTTTADSRPDYTVSGTATGSSATFDGCAYRTFRNWTMNSATTVNDSIFDGGLLITQGGATIDGCLFTGGTNATNTAYMDSDDPESITNCVFESGGAGHAIELSPTGNQSYTFDNLQFTGYTGTAGSAALWWNPTGGTENLTIDVTNTPSNAITTSLIRNSSTGTVTVNNSVTLTLTGIETDSEVRLINLDDVENFNKELAGNEQIHGVVVAAEVVDGGSGYTNGTQTLTVVGGTGTAATIDVTVAGGVVTAVSAINTAGDYTANPPTPATTTGGGGTGATLRLTIAGTFTYSYDSSFNPRVAIIIFHLDFAEVRIEQNLSTASQTIPIQQRTDRVYNNP